jgi:predicted transposase YdaD
LTYRADRYVLEIIKKGEKEEKGRIERRKKRRRKKRETYLLYCMKYILVLLVSCIIKILTGI